MERWAILVYLGNVMELRKGVGKNLWTVCIGFVVTF